MKPHSWDVIGPATVGTYAAIAGKSVVCTKRMPVLWVRCKNCNAELTTTEDIIKAGTVHEGWSIPEDCDETVIELIMRE
jgi:hypothetical protein